MDEFDKIIKRLEEVTGSAPRGGATRRKALCPAHADDEPSLSLHKDTDAGLVGMTCFAGCEFDEIVEALDLTAGDFRLSASGGGKKRSGKRKPDPEPAERGRDKGAPAGRELERYPYVDEDGKVLYYNVRFEPKDFRMAGPDGKIKAMPRNMRRVPYRLDRVIEAVEQGRTVYWIEGERDVHTLEKRGEVATTTAGGANAPIDLEWAQYFEGANVVVIEDKDKPGRSYARNVAQALINVAASVVVRQSATPQAKSDVTDHLQAGYELDQLVPVHLRSVRRTRWTVADLLNTPPEPLRWVFPGMIPEGLTLLVGAPKVGKSWWNIDLMVALASGRPDQVFDFGQQLEPTPSLYLALEDPHRRVYSRLRQVSQGVRVPWQSAGEVWLDLPPINKGGREEVEKWLEANPDARCVMVDVLAKIRPEASESAGLYQADYEAIGHLKEIADDYGIGVVVTHHDRKRTDEDFLNMVSGTKGVTGAADTILYLTRDRGSTEGLLRLESRDVEECQYRLEFQRQYGRWHIVAREESGASEEALPQTLKDEIAGLLKARGYATSRELAELTKRDQAEVLRELRGDETLFQKQKDGTWHVPKH